MEAHVIKLNGSLYPASDHDRELMSAFKTGEAVKVKLTRFRNYDFHKKWFSLVNLAYDYWEPPDNQVAEKNFDRFRKDITILAGFYETSVRLDGETRVEARSISFSKMSEEEFEKLYSKTIDVIIKYVLKQYTGEMLREIVDQVEAYG